MHQTPPTTLHRAGAPSSAKVRQNRSTFASWLEGVPRQVFIALLVAAGYYLGSRVGFLLTPHGTPISTLWPPNAVLLAALLLTPYRMWWLFLLAVFPAHLLVQLPTGVPLSTASGWFISNSVEALLGAAIVRYFKKPEELFESVSGVLVFLAFGVIFAALASSFVDAAVVVTTGFGNDYWKLWTFRLFSNVLADLTVAPTLIVFVLNGGRWARHLSRSQIVEATLLMAGIIAVSSVVFGLQDPTIPALMYIPLPLVVWVVVRFGVYGLYPSLLAISIISIWNAMHDRGPFVIAPMHESVLAIQIFLSTIALPMMLLAAVLAERKAAEESLHKSRGRLIDAQEQERRRIARELHDDIGQQLTVLELELGQLKEQSGEPLRPRLERLHRQVYSASATARAISHGLHSAALEFLGLVPAVRSLCEAVAKETSIEIEFTEDNVPATMNSETSLCLYRVAQEALSNIARHSHAHRAAVRLQGRDDRIVLDIADDGVGMVEEREHGVGLGLASMQERVGLSGGTFNLVSQPASGTRIEATIPLKRMQS